VLQELPHKHIVKTCVFSPNSSKLATGGKEALLRVFRLDECLQASKTEASLEIPQASAITKLAWVTDSVVLCALEDGNVAVWDTNAPTAAVHTFSTKQAELIRDMELVTLTTGQQVLTVVAGSMIYFFDLSTKQLLHQWKMPIHFRDEGGASLHPSGTKFVAGGSDLWVRVFDFATGEEQECHKGHHGPIRCLRYSPDGTSYATGSEDGTIRLWKTDPESSQ
jgi:serine-threonine kinase receptor-associated protein